MTDAEFALTFSSTDLMDLAGPAPSPERLHALDVGYDRLRDEAVRRWNEQQAALTDEACALAFYGTELGLLDLGRPTLTTKLRPACTVASGRRRNKTGVRQRRSSKGVLTAF
jgi:hypothetical protein